ncbi:MAG TPA: hypothetical protein VK961_20805 [Chthoniobacter sp.]|nr:hypothetical protein [Chthoniobacter sp.]
MKAAFEVLKGRQRIMVNLTRDSVCAGDDCDAHDKTVEAYSFLDPVAFAQETSSGYLPSIAGVGHTWTCVMNGVKIAEIGTSGIRSLERSTPFSEENNVHFVYHSSPY